jgi:hypothetical protein
VCRTFQNQQNNAGHSDTPFGDLFGLNSADEVSHPFKLISSPGFHSIRESQRSCTSHMARPLAAQVSDIGPRHASSLASCFPRLHSCFIKKPSAPLRVVSKGNVRREEQMMTSKHPKQKKPTDMDLRRNPLIGGSKGTTMAHVTAEELQQLEGVNTIEGDVENDTNPQGGIDKAEVRNARRGPPGHGREPPPRPAEDLHFNKARPKGAGSGAMANLHDQLVGENVVLPNRDKVVESGDRGQDGKWIETEQLADHVANKGRG